MAASYPILDWCGGHIGEISHYILESERVKCFVNIKFRPGYKIYYVIGYKCKDLLPCIVDELCPEFGLTKIGSHGVYINGIQYIIYNMGSKSKKASEYLGRDNVSFRRNLNNLIVYRMILGLNINTMDMFHVKKGKPVSIRNKINSKAVDGTISKGVMDILDEDIIDIIRRMKVYSDKDRIIIILKIDEIIKRIDKDLIWFKNQILTNLNKFY